MKYWYPLFILLTLLLSGLYTDYSVFVYVLSAVSLYKLLQKIGNGVALREMIAVYTCIIYLIMPMFGYQWYTANFSLAKMWVKYMPIAQETYFGFVYPAVSIFIVAMFFPSLSSTPELDTNLNLMPVIQRAQEKLKKKNIWLPLLSIGLFGFFFRSVITISSLTFFMYSFYLVLFSALLCIYFTPRFKYRRLLLVFIILLIVYEAVQSGMFTIVVYMGVVIGSIIFIGTRIAFWKKITITAVAILFILILQTTKGSFRKQTWRRGYEGSKVELFTGLMKDNFSNLDKLFDKNAFFFLYTRMNQGYNVSLVMKRIPAVQDYDEGKSIYLTVASSLLPRVIWQDKLESGGIYNMKHFAGWNIKGWSTNIGPIGEAYGNFGVTGGIIYMFFFGLFIRTAFFIVLRLSSKYPLLLFWIPVLFFELSYSMENDTLQAMNAVIKGSVFVWIMYKIAPYLFTAPKKNDKLTDENSPHIRNNRPGWSLPG